MIEICCLGNQKKEDANHVSFDTVAKYLLENSYPLEIFGDKGKKSTSFCMLIGHLIYKNTGLIISPRERYNSRCSCRVR